MVLYVLSNFEISGAIPTSYIFNNGPLFPT